MDKKSPMLRRVLWSVVLFVCLSLMLYQCLDRILRYTAEPVNVNVRITHNESLEFPSVTVCNKNVYNLTRALELLVGNKLLPKTATEAMVNVSILVGLNGMTSTDVWNELALQRKKFICWFGRGIDCDNVGNWTLVHTTIGPCYMFEMENSQTNLTSSFNNLFLRFQETSKLEKSDSGVRVVLHEPGDSAVLLVRTDSMSAEYGWARDVKLELRKFQILSTNHNPCLDDPAYSKERCLSDCFQAAVTANTKCRMPYMTAAEKSGDVNGSTSVFRDCITPNEYEEAFYTLDQMLFHGVGWNPHECDCQHECQETTFLNYPENLVYKPKNIRMRIFYTELVYENIQEEFAYTMIALLCDIGGTLGLLMGASVLTVCELLEVAWSRMLRIICVTKKRSQTPPAPALVSIVKVKPSKPTVVVPRDNRRVQLQPNYLRPPAFHDFDFNRRRLEDAYFGERIKI
ncbi:acid-sensing ion channel 2-like isoform X2 [Neocloeon triangulifer]|uniref:acid-sensing ion channel 2-like isoform X2 n=1 Tax=Neocloeon triangulifer TaxID=2078957 RepID=UPI00286EE1CE|nr:acid-sensing ion channel 2-like isoform X2 [Neocloeon triangulifer]